ncbi:MAG: hypothetical protein K0R94_900 [Burkholderiales bacterium]|nr:hypothetical protein [Burkholderiales bacterium]
MIQSRPMINNHKRITIISKVVIIQLAMGLVAVLLLTVHQQNINTLPSSIIGLALAIVPTIVYTKIAFGGGLFLAPHVVYLRHKKAMISRFITNLLLFSIVLVAYKQCDYFALLITYIATLSGYWMSLIIIK